MTALEASLKRRMAALESECETLAIAVDNLSIQIRDAYQILQKHEPQYVAEKMGQSVRTPVESVSVQPNESNTVPEDAVTMPQR